MCTARQIRPLTAARVSACDYCLRLRQDLAPAGPQPQAAGNGIARRLHGLATSGSAQEVRAVGAKHRPHPRRSEEMCEAIIQPSPYSGYAPALNALRWLSEVL